MSLGNTALWGDVLPGGLADESAAGGIDTTEVIDELLASLHAASRADLTFWTEADLIQWLDEALKRLSRVACAFVGIDSSRLTVPGQATYALPDRHVATLHISAEGVALRPSTSRELEARDSSYQTASGTPTRWYADRIGVDQVGLAKVPTLELSLVFIYNGWPEPLDAGKQQTMVAAPAPIKGYLAMYALAEANARAGQAQAPDVAEHCRARVQLYEQILASYYGSGM